MFPIAIQQVDDSGNLIEDSHILVNCYAIPRVGDCVQMRAGEVWLVKQVTHIPSAVEGSTLPVLHITVILERLGDESASDGE